MLIALSTLGVIYGAALLWQWCEPEVCRVTFEPRDAWVGVYWTDSSTRWRRSLTVYVCPLPMLPIRMEVS